MRPRPESIRNASAPPPLVPGALLGAVGMEVLKIVGGIYVPFGPTVGALITILLTESLRIWCGTGAIGWDNVVYGTLLVVFIIFLPQGLLGSLLAWLTPRRGRAG